MRKQLISALTLISLTACDSSQQDVTATAEQAEGAAAVGEASVQAGDCPLVGDNLLANPTFASAQDNNLPHPWRATQHASTPSFEVDFDNNTLTIRRCPRCTRCRNQSNNAVNTTPNTRSNTNSPGSSKITAAVPSAVATKTIFRITLSMLATRVSFSSSKTGGARNSRIEAA